VQKLHWVFVACVTLVFSGCGRSGPALIPVTGKVIKAGKGVAGAGVLFTPDSGRPAEAITEADGSFVLRTYEPGDGALPGTHKVTVHLKKMVTVAANADGLESGFVDMTLEANQPKEQWIVPQKYSELDSTDLKVEVKPEMQPVTLDVTKP
jgi:hypothetical protein